MKTTTILTALLLLIGLSAFDKTNEEQLSKEDRKFLLNYYKETQKSLLLRIENLSDEQWHYKTAEDRWSVAEVAEHILKAETSLIKRAKDITAHNHSPNKIEAQNGKEKEIIRFITDRSKKFPANEAVVPEGKYPTAEAFIDEYLSFRKETQKYVRSTKDPLKGYFQENPLFTEVNGFHWLVFIGAHTERHILQIQEVLNDPNFPQTIN